ncbi:MAG: glycosyl hydrolase family 8, partial [Chloroflexota bacterium]
INAIWEHEIDKPGNQPAAGLNDNQGYELIPGDLFNLEADFPNGLVNLSYFSPAHFRVFAQFTDNPEWDEVISRQYDLADAAEQIDGNCSSLVPNWSTYDGQVQEVPWHGATSAYFGWDGGRYAWRVALDNFWYGDERADASLNKIGGFFASVGIGNVRTQYRLNGTRVDNYPTPYFLSMATAAIWGASDPIASDCGDARGTLLTTPQQAYDTIANLGHENYYNDSWRLLTMMLLTGYFQNPLADAETPVTPSPSTPEPTPIDSITSTTVPTNVPSSTPTATQASNNPPVSGCDVNVSLQSEWNSGYTAQVNIRNRASAPISGWTLSLDLAPNVTLLNAWNVETSSQSGTVLIVGAGQNHYNGVIPARGVVSFGFQVSHSGSYSVPIVLNINGTSCSGTVINPPTPQPTSVQPTTIPVQPTTQPNTPVPPATATPVAPVVTVGCTVTFSFSNTWNTGYTASVLVRNDGTTPIRDWSLNFNLGSDVTVSNSWGSGSQTQSGSTVTMRSTGNHYNAVIQPGQQIQLGFNASHNGNFSQPTGFALNSQTC